MQACEPDDDEPPSKKPSPAVFKPSKKRIKQMCKEIQATWSEQEERRRRGKSYESHVETETVREGRME